MNLSKKGVLPPGRHYLPWTTLLITQPATPQPTDSPHEDWFWSHYWLLSHVSSHHFRSQFLSARCRSVSLTWWSWSVSMYLDAKTQRSATLYICYLVSSAFPFSQDLQADSVSSPARQADIWLDLSFWHWLQGCLLTSSHRTEFWQLSEWSLVWRSLISSVLNGLQFS